MEKQTISSQRQNSFEKWEPIVHAGSIIITSALAHSAYLSERISGTISKEGIILACVANGVASYLGPKISDAFGIDSNWKKVAITVSTFAVLSFATPYIATNLLMEVVGEVTQGFVLTLGLSSLFIRATVFTLYTLSQVNQRGISTPEQIASPKEIETLAAKELAEYKVELESDNYKKWNDLSFSMQMAFNKKWPDSKSRIPFTKLADAVINSSEDLDIILSATKESRTKEFAQFLFDHDLPPMRRDYEQKELPSLNYALGIVEIEALSNEKVRWYHTAFCIEKKVLTTDLKEVKEYQHSWYFHHLNKHLSEWKALPLQTQYAFNTHFFSVLNKKLPLFLRTLNEILGADQPLINDLQKQYADDFSLWIAMSPAFCKELNKKFKVPITLLQNANDIRKLSKKELETFRQAFENEQISMDQFTPDLYQVFQERFIMKGIEVPECVNLIADNYVPTWKKVAVIGLVINLIAAPMLAIFGLPFLTRSSKNQKNDPCMGEGCKPEPIFTAYPNQSRRSSFGETVSPNQINLPTSHANNTNCENVEVHSPNHFQPIFFTPPLVLEANRCTYVTTQENPFCGNLETANRSVDSQFAIQPNVKLVLEASKENRVAIPNQSMRSSFGETVSPIQINLPTSHANNTNCENAEVRSPNHSQPIFVGPPLVLEADRYTHVTIQENPFCGNLGATNRSEDSQFAIQPNVKPVSETASVLLENKISTIWSHEAKPDQLGSLPSQPDVNSSDCEVKSKIIDSNPAYIFGVNQKLNHKERGNQTLANDQSMLGECIVQFNQENSSQRKAEESNNDYSQTYSYGTGGILAFIILMVFKVARRKFSHLGSRETVGMGLEEKREPVKEPENSQDPDQSKEITTFNQAKQPDNKEDEVPSVNPEGMQKGENSDLTGIRPLPLATALLEAEKIDMQNVLRPTLATGVPVIQKPSTPPSEAKRKNEGNFVGKENIKPNVSASYIDTMNESSKIIPLITKDTLKDCKSMFINLPEWKGVSLMQGSPRKNSSFAWQGMPIKKGDKYELESKEKLLAGYQSPLDRFKNSSDNLPSIPKDFNPESFVYPNGSIVLDITEKEMGIDRFKEAYFILSEDSHKLDALCFHGNKEITESPSWIFGRKIPTKAAIFQIKTLAFRDFPSLNVSFLMKIGKDFPNIACLDLRGTELRDDINKLEELKKRFILLGPNNDSNAAEHLKALNKFLLDAINESSNEKINDLLLLLFPKIGMNDSRYSNISPAACFVSNLSFLRGLPISDSTFKELMVRLPYYFRSVKMLDISKCEKLTLASFQLLEKISIERLSMIDCQCLLSNNSQINMDFEKFRKTLDNLIKKGLIFIDMRLLLGVDQAFINKTRPILKQNPTGVYPELHCSMLKEGKYEFKKEQYRVRK